MLYNLCRGLLELIGAKLPSSAFHYLEMSFRVAHFGAWHLGSNFEARREIRNKLKRAYGQASRAVHDGQVQSTEDNRQLLLQTQELCRRGILKLLQEGEPKDWGDIVLGSGLEGELNQ